MERGVKRRHTPTMKTNKKRTKLPVLCAGLIASAATAFAGEQTLPTPPQSGYVDTESSVIYINTFSKSLSPSMRMGYMILPPALLEGYEARLGSFSCSVPVLDQYVLAEFIGSGSFERHLNRVRKKMKK